MVDQKPVDIQNQVTQLKQWIEQQPHLPKNLDNKLIRRFLHSCYYDMEKAKTTAELFFSVRSSAPELLTNRDPQSAPMQKIMKIINLANYQIGGKRNIWIWQLNDPGLDNYDYLLDAKLFFLSTDSWLLDNEDMEEDDVAILDVKDLSLKFLTKFNVSIAKKLSKYQEDAMPLRLKGVHIINTPPVIDKLYALMKPFMKQEMTDMVHFHTPKSKTLYDFVKKEDLPEEFGGTRGSIAEHNAKAYDLMIKYREQLIDENFWRSEKKGKGNKTECSTEIGSFRTLAID